MTQETKASNLILQQSVGGESPRFKIKVKDPQNEFKEIAVIYRTYLSVRGEKQAVYTLYDANGKHLAAEQDREYLEQKTTPELQHQLREIAIEKWQRDELEKAKGKQTQIEVQER